MALLFMESFDGYGGTAAHATKWASLSLATSSPAPRTGTHRMAFAGGTRYFVTGSNTIIVGFAYYWAGSTGFCQIQRDGVISQCSVTMETDGRLHVRTGGISSTIIDSTASVLVSGSWNFIEIKITVGNSGTYTLKVNGVQVLTGSGDTQGGSDATLGGVSFNPQSAQGIDDLYVLDGMGGVNNDFIGDCKVECLLPQAGNGSNVGLTCSSGTDHGALVLERPATDDTGYVYGTTAGVKDTYLMTDTATVGAVKAVQVTARARKTDSPTKELALVARVGGTDSDGPTQAVATTTYGQYQQVWETKPAGGPWLIADLNGAEFGLKVVS